MPTGWFPLLVSLRVATLSATVALLLATWPAWAIATREFAWKRSILVAGAILALVPAVVFGYLLLPAFSWPVAVAVSLIQAVPYLLGAARTAFAAIPLEYRKAALVVGASEWQIFWRVALPLAYRPLLLAACGVFASTLLQFLAALLIVRLRGGAV